MSEITVRKLQKIRVDYRLFVECEKEFINVFETADFLKNLQRLLYLIWF